MGHNIRWPHIADLVIVKNALQMLQYVWVEVILDQSQGIGERVISQQILSNVLIQKLVCKYILKSFISGMIEPNMVPTGECEIGYQGILCSDCAPNYSRSGAFVCK
jgi:hypothetical protein